jgi:hypothetical protein
MEFRLLTNYRKPYDTLRNTKGKVPIPATARFMAWVLGCSQLGLWIRIPPKACMSVNVVCSQLEISASGWSLVQRKPTECSVSVCGRDIWIMRPSPNRDFCVMGK